MYVVRNLNNIKEELQNSCLTLGNFDGLHLGHQKILKFTKELAKKDNLKSALLTFEPHPRHFFNPDSNKNVRIHSLTQKLEILRAEKLVDLVFLIHFNQNLANLSASDFVRNILNNKLKVKNLIVGYDFSFGKNRLGNSELLKELAPENNYEMHQIDVNKDKNEQIYSSTNIRNLIENGKVKEAAIMLGRNLSIKGTVIEGEQNGRKIGFKTANILPKTHIIKPKFGVYKSITKIDGISHNSITNFGIKPTFLGKKELFENHIFNFDQDIYSKRIKIELLDFIRPEMKFNGIEELKEQIKRDIEFCY